MQFSTRDHIAIQVGGMLNLIYWTYSFPGGVTQKERKMNERSVFHVFPQLILLKEDKVLLLRRAANSKIFAGYWHLPTGKVETGESPRDAMIREGKEEIGISVSPLLSTVIYNKTPNFFVSSNIWEDICLFFSAQVGDEEPYNVEPDKHDAMEWFALDNLPDPMVPVIKFGLTQFQKGEHYAEFIETK